MAWVFSLSVECGSERSAAETFSHAFDGRIVEGHATRTRVFADAGAWWCSVCVDVETGGEADALQERLAQALLERLRSAPPFRFGHVGVEVDLFRTWDELAGERFEHQAFAGVVLSDAAWRRAGSPGGFAVFRPGYVWRPRA